MLMSFSKGSGAATVAFDELSATLCISPDQRKHEETCFHSMCFQSASASVVCGSSSMSSGKHGRTFWMTSSWWPTCASSPRTVGLGVDWAFTIWSFWARLTCSYGSALSNARIRRSSSSKMVEGDAGDAGKELWNSLAASESNLTTIRH